MQAQGAVDCLNRLGAEDRERRNRGIFRAHTAQIYEAVAPLVRFFENADLSTRIAITDGLSVNAKDQLVGYARHMAVLAVREGSSARVQEGLTALAIEAGGGGDWRESVSYLALLYHSALKLGMDAPVAFEQAASLSVTNFQEAIRSFPLRAPRDRDIEFFSRREVMTKDGFDYR
jgi:hypothetical protein